MASAGRSRVPSWPAGFTAGAATASPRCDLSVAKSSFSLRWVSLPPGTQRPTSGLGARPYRLGIALAEIAALAAIELGRRRHELALWFSITGQRQALGHGERRFVPGLIFVRFVGFGCRGIRDWLPRN